MLTATLEPAIRKVASHESIFRNSKSFAEEIADALCTRVKEIGKSHPTVTTGKQRRLMEGLMHISEAVRTANKDVQRESKMETNPCDKDKGNSVDGHILLEPNIPPRNRKKPAKELKTILKTPKQAIHPLPISLTFNNCSDETSEVNETSVFKMNTCCSRIQEASRGSRYIHTRLALDNSEMNNNPNENRITDIERLGIKPGSISRTGSPYVPLDAKEHQIPRNNASWNGRTSIKFLSKKRRESFRSFIQTKLKKKPRSEDKLSCGSKIESCVNNNSLKTVRKRLQGAFNRIKETVKAK